MLPRADNLFIVEKTFLLKHLKWHILQISFEDCLSI